MGEDEGGAGDVADFAGAGGRVREDAPAPFEQGESSFSEFAKAAQEPVVGIAVRAPIPVGSIADIIFVAHRAIREARSILRAPGAV